MSSQEQLEGMAKVLSEAGYQVKSPPPPAPDYLVCYCEQPATWAFWGNVMVGGFQEFYCEPHAKEDYKWGEESDDCGWIYLPDHHIQLRKELLAQINGSRFSSLESVRARLRGLPLDRFDRNTTPPNFKSEAADWALEQGWIINSNDEIIVVVPEEVLQELRS